MKCIFTTLILLVVSLAFSQQWYPSYAPHGRDVEASYIISPDAILLGAGFEVAEQFEDIFWSSDYGIIWNVYGTDTPTSMVRSIVFTDSLTGYGVCYLGKFIKTTDGGHNWYKADTIANKNFFEIISQSASGLFVVGGSRQNDTATILKSTNGGNSWTVVYNQPGRWLRSISFINQITGFAVGDSSIILTTTDGGNNWQPVSSPVSSRSFTGVVFTDNTNGYIIGGIRDSVRTLLKTTDAGQSWIAIQDGPGGAYNDIDFLNAATGYIVGDSATVLKTTDGGNTWLPETITGADAGQRICTVHFYDTDLGIIGGMGGFVRIYTTAAPTQVVTFGSIPVDTTNALLIGKVNTYGIPVECDFYVSADSTFPWQNTLVYGSVYKYDSLSYHTVQVNQLQPHTKYYYYLQARSLTGTVRGDTLSFTTTMPAFTLTVSSAYSVTLVSATVNGLVKGLPSPATISFEYGTTSALGYEVPASPMFITDTVLHTVTANLTQLSPGTGYNFRIKALTPSGPYYSAMGYFTTPAIPDNYATLPATGVTASSAILNGIVFNQSSPVALSFKYGTTPLLGNSIAATPDTVYDNGQYFPSAFIEGLQGNTVYYYALQVDSGSGNVRCGDTLVFYTGTPQIPNWGFENWEQKIQYYPQGWYYYGNVGPAVSYNATTALHVYTGSDSTGSVAFNGIPFPGMDPLIGSPFTARPDSVVFYANYNIQPGDTGFMLLVMKKNFVPMADARYPFTGSTGGAYVRCSAPITYTATSNPDSVIMAFATSIGLFDNPTPNQNSIKIDDISFTGTSQKIINYNFEDFDTLQLDIPSGWQIASDAPVNITPLPPVSRTTDAAEGQYAVKLETMNAPAANLPVSAAIATQQTGGGQNRPGFPVYYRCQTFNGYYKYQPVGADTMNLYIQMFKNGNVIANSYMQVGAATNGYVQFSLPINYYTTDIPDSGAIYIRNSMYSPGSGTVLLVDALGFDGFTGVDNETAAKTYDKNGVRLYPNPTANRLIIHFEKVLSDFSTVELYNFNGAVVLTENLPAGVDIAGIDVSALPSGFYLVKLTSGKVAYNSKVAIVR